VNSYTIFGARTKHKKTQPHKTHHGFDLEEATTFPLIVFFVPSHRLAPKCHFVPGLPSWNPEILEIETLTTLEAHNFFYIPSIEMKVKEKL
jgi:hypothetical protein